MLSCHGPLSPTWSRRRARVRPGIGGGRCRKGRILAPRHHHSLRSRTGPPGASHRDERSQCGSSRKRLTACLRPSLCLTEKNGGHGLPRFLSALARIAFRSVKRGGGILDAIDGKGASCPALALALADSGLLPEEGPRCGKNGTNVLFSVSGRRLRPSNRACRDFWFQ